MRKRQENPEAENGSDTRETDGREQKWESSLSTEDLVEASPNSSSGETW